jgi:hypothetical protein
MKGTSDMSLDLQLNGMGVVVKSEISEQKISLADFINLDEEVAKPVQQEVEQVKAEAPEEVVEALPEEFDSNVDSITENDPLVSIEDASDTTILEKDSLSSPIVDAEVVLKVSEKKPFDATIVKDAETTFVDNDPSSDGGVAPAKASEQATGVLKQGNPELHIPKDGDFELYGFSVRYQGAFDREVRQEEVSRHFKSIDDIKARFRESDLGSEYLVLTAEEIAKQDGTPRVTEVWGLVGVGRPAICMEDRELLSYFEGKWGK